MIVLTTPLPLSLPLHELPGLPPGVDLPDGTYLGGLGQRVFRSCVPRLPQQISFPEPYRPEFLEEDPCFLRASDSGKPVIFARLLLRRERLLQDEFCRVNSSVCPDHSGQFAEDGIACGIQIEDAVD